MSFEGPTESQISSMVGWELHSLPLRVSAVLLWPHCLGIRVGQSLPRVTPRFLGPQGQQEWDQQQRDTAEGQHSGQGGFKPQHRWVAS